MAYNPAGSLQFDKTDRYETGRIKGRWEDAMINEIPEANERAWNQGAEEVVADGKVDSEAEVRAIGDWYRSKLGENKGTQSTAAPTQPSQELLAARGIWDDLESRRGEGSIPFNPTGDGILDAATYGNLATNDFANRFKQQLNAQANLEGHEMGDVGNYHLNRFEGVPTELASSGIRDVYDRYSKEIQGIA
jgi:hypothetical protein